METVLLLAITCGVDEWNQKYFQVIDWISVAQNELEELWTLLNIKKVLTELMAVYPTGDACKFTDPIIFSVQIQTEDIL